MKSILIGLLLAGLSGSMVSAKTIVAASSTIDTINTYTEYGNGDVVFRFKEPQNACYGYWLASDSAGFEANLSILLSAYHTTSIITAKGDLDRIWPGSGSSFCHLYNIQLGPQS